MASALGVVSSAAAAPRGGFARRPSRGRLLSAVATTGVARRSSAESTILFMGQRRGASSSAVVMRAAADDVDVQEEEEEERGGEAVEEEEVVDEEEQEEEEEEKEFQFFGLEGEELAASIDALRAVEIKAELRAFGVSGTGLKGQLAERLTECYRLTVRAATAPPDTVQNHTLKKPIHTYLGIILAKKYNRFFDAARPAACLIQQTRRARRLLCRIPLNLVCLSLSFHSNRPRSPTLPTPPSLFLLQKTPQKNHNSRSATTR
jgi:hypothetical protein